MPEFIWGQLGMSAHVVAVIKFRVKIFQHYDNKAFNFNTPVGLDLKNIVTTIKFRVRIKN